ncbi:MAG TPA: CAP domain-containing protein, partial [Thermoanaerobaculia bacterium]|nr:CAP domain-containing protein [Thermoanaerobaculia bacterium]
RFATHMRILGVLILVPAFLAPVKAAEITRAAVVAEMNVHRAAAGLPPLREDDRLIRVANLRMRDMEELAYWDHVAPDGRTPFELLRPSGYQYQQAGENLASGFETAEVLVQSWMESKGHRDNILSPVYQDCGVAIIEGSTLGRSTGRSVVVMFGRALPSASPPTQIAR